MLTSSRLYAKEFSFDKSSSMKLTIYQKLRNSNGNTFSFIPYVYYFSYHPWIAVYEDWSLNTQEHQNPEFHHSPPPLYKNHRKTEVDKKSSMQDTYTDQQLCIFLVQMLKTISISSITFELVRTLYSIGLLSNLYWKQ